VGEIPWTNLDDFNRMILEDRLKQYKIGAETPEAVAGWLRAGVSEESQ
jgi:hypothetical protein